MTHDIQTRGGFEERVSAETRVFDEPIALHHEVNVMSEKPAEVPDLLFERVDLCVRIVTDGKEQRMSALDARILMMAVANGDAHVIMLSEKARERVPDACERAIGVQVARAAPAMAAGTAAAAK